VARYHGKRGRVYLSAGGTGAAISVGKLTNWTLNMAKDKVEVTSFDDGNKTYVMGYGDISGTLAGFWDDTDDTLFACTEAAGAVKVYLYPSADIPTKYWYGEAYVDASINTDVAGAVAVSANFAGAGTWARE
jgi:hypothetical protein